MRISDWSSDVCSSDLLDRQMRLQLAPEGDAFQQGAAPVQPRQAEAEGRVHVEVAVDEGRRHQVPAGVDLLPRRRLDLRSHFGDAAILHGDVLPARSEEHTSELQSLMRISYAVFCLKK